MDSQGKLLDLINETNDPVKPLTQMNVKFMGVTAGSGDQATLLLEGVAGRGYSGQAELTYKRLDLSEILAGAKVRAPDELTPDSFLALLNNAYNLFLTTLDLELIEIPPLGEGEVAQIQLTTLPNSYGFHGDVAITLEFGKSWLDQVVARKSLNTLTHPIKVEYAYSARMLTWNRDFTCLRDAIKPNAKGEYSDWDTLQKACTAMGIPTWVQRAGLVDQPTSAVPDANPKFQRVVIQSNVPLPGGAPRIMGPMYFHYNVLEEI